MKHALYLAWQSLRWHRGRALLVVLCLTLTLWLPLTVRLLLRQFQSDITSRATQTPLVIGARGSRIDLALHALYFEAAPPGDTAAGEVDRIQASGLATAIPVCCRYHTQSLHNQPGAPIVGTTPEYFEYRQLQVADGRLYSFLGECVIGAGAARRMRLKPGDSLLSAPRNVFDLAGAYPLKLKITGVLAESSSPDDQAVFTDTRTVWIIDGLGHGHQDLAQSSDDSLLLSRDDDRLTASAAVLPYTEITPENIDSFHFHGDSSTFPLTAIIAVPASQKARILLLGRYAADAATVQCLQPPEVVGELLSIVFRIEQLMWVSSAIALLVTLLLLGLVLLLTMRLRAAEMQTLFRLGCRRGTLALLLGSELALLLIASGSMAVLAAGLTQYAAADSLRQLLF